MRTVKAGDKEFKYFIDRCEYYKNELKLDAEIAYEQESNNYNLAWFEYMYESNKAVIWLNKEIVLSKDLKSVNQLLDRTAFHEIFEIMLNGLVISLIDIPSNENTTEHKLHSIIFRVWDLFNKHRK